MRRFSLVARLGPDDKTKVVPLQRDSVVFEIDFLNANRRLGFGIGQALQELWLLGLRPPEMAVDLTIVAALVNAGDTRVSRRENAQDAWTREIDLYVPVSEPDRWRAVTGDLERLLRFLTGDRWRVIFRHRPRRMASIVNPLRRPPVAELEEVILFSGGLDSLIGVIDLMASGLRPILVSHYWDSETANAQTRLLQKLRRHFPRPQVKSVRVRLGFDKHRLDTGESEDTQRGRSFLFYALAAFAASSFGYPSQVYVPENGLIALNVPLDPLRLGALSTRTAHPHFLAGMGNLLDQIGLRVRLTNPYRHRTKGEMVATCKDLEFLKTVVGDSMSCSSPAKARYKGLSPRHCGYCVPCLIRRASLKAGLGCVDPTPYAIHDLGAQTLRSDRSEGVDVRSFQLLAKRLERRQELAKILVHKPGPLTDVPDDIPGYVDVFKRGVREVSELLQRVEATPGP